MIFSASGAWPDHPGVGFLSGTSFPVAALPPPLRAVAVILPTRMAIDGLRAALIGGRCTSETGRAVPGHDRTAPLGGTRICHVDGHRTARRRLGRDSVVLDLDRSVFFGLNDSADALWTRLIEVTDDVTGITVV